MIKKKEYELDNDDRELLEKLTRDWGTYIFPVQKTAKEMGLHRTSIYKKIKRMEKLGIIKGYKAIIDESKTGKDVDAIICVGVYPWKSEKAEPIKEKIIAEDDRIKDVYEVSGHYQFDTMYHVICRRDEFWDLLMKIRRKIINTRGSQTLNIILKRKEHGELVPLA